MVLLATRSPSGRAALRAGATATTLGLLLGGGSSGLAQVSASATDRASTTTHCETHRFTRTQARHVLGVAENRLRATLTAVPLGDFPANTGPAGTWRTTSAKAWTSGFFPGSLWLAYAKTHRAVYRSVATAWTHAEAGQTDDRSTHDVGFKVLGSFGNGYRLTHRASYERALARGAASLASRYDPTVGAIRSWGRRHDERHFKVIVDGLVNDELLFVAGRREGKPRWTRMATQHALTTARHFVRRDGSVIHLVDFDARTGRVQRTANPQGFSRSSTWSRGQAWAVAGFGTAYRWTGRTSLLRAARRTAGYFVGHLPTDCVPYWDFDAPGVPDADTDSSAAAIAADGLLQLSVVDPDRSHRRRYARDASSILWSLAHSYVAPGGQATLTGATATHGVQPGNIGTSYGDYYLMRAVGQWLRSHP